jgi:biopolymer transport protein ExbD
MRSWIVLAVVVAGCKGDGGKAGPSGQTLHDALGILCGRGPQPPDVSKLSPAERQRELGNWLDHQIQHPQVRALVAALGDAQDRAAGVRKAAADAGLLACTPIALFRSNKLGGADLPEVVAAPSATTELDQDLPIIVITPTAVVVDGRSILAVHDGAVDPVEWPKLGSFLGAFAASGDGSFERVVVAADRTLTTGLLVAVLDAAITAGARRLELAVTVGDHEPRLVPVGVPESATGQSLGDGGMVADIGPDQLALFGTGRDTAFASRRLVPLAPADGLGARVQASLGAIVNTTWRARGFTIVVFPEAKTSVQTFAEIVVAIRAAPDGERLFPDVVLGRRPDPPGPPPVPVPGGGRQP